MIKRPNSVRLLGAMLVCCSLVAACQTQYNDYGPCYSGIECTTGACYDGICVQTCNEPCKYGYQCVVYGDGVWCVDPALVSLVNKPSTGSDATVQPKPDGYTYVDEDAKADQTSADATADTMAADSSSDGLSADSEDDSTTSDVATVPDLVADASLASDTSGADVSLSSDGDDDGSNSADLTSADTTTDISAD